MKKESLVHTKIKLAAHQQALKCTLRTLGRPGLPAPILASLKESLKETRRDIKAAKAELRNLIN